MFVARDEVNNLLLPSNQATDVVSLPQRVWSGVLRYRRDVGQASTVGLIYAGRQADGYHNHLYGADAFWRASNTDTVRFQYTRSDTLYPEAIATSQGLASGALTGGGLLADYNHQSQDWFWLASYQDLGRDYRADSGFVPRVDVRTLEGRFARILRGQAGRWYSQLDLQAVGLRTEDHDGRLTDQRIGVQAIYSGPRQSLLDLTFSKNKALLEGVTYDLDQVDVVGEIRPSGTIRINLTGTLGDALDFANARLGTGVKLGPEVQYRAGRHVELRLGHNLERVSVDAGRVFTANLTQGRFVYYLGTRAFARVILQYLDLDQDPELYTQPVEPHTKHLFSQLLFSYKVNPQTVVFVGYSDNQKGRRASRSPAATARSSSSSATPGFPDSASALGRGGERVRARVAARRLAHVPAERGAEGARRAVADAFGDLGDPEVVAAEQILRDGHAPGEQVFHRRQAHGAHEALEERRARERGRLRELGHRPRTRELAVHLPHRGREPRIGQPAQQPRRRVFARRRPQRFDEQHLHEAREHEIAARPPLARFLADEPHQYREPLGAAHVHERRQQRHQQRRVGRVEGEPAAQQPYVGATTARAVAHFTRRARTSPSGRAARASPARSQTW